MRRYRIAAGLLITSALVSWVVARSQAARYEVNLNELPMTIGSWEGRNIDLKRADLVYEVLETSAVLSRVYVRRDGQGETVDLLVTYFERGHRGFHPPEVSFVASGNTITRSDRVSIPLAGAASGPPLETNRFLGNTPTGDVLYLYWFSIGDDVMASYYKGSVYLLWNAVLQRPRPASMVRVALPIVGGDLERTMVTAGEFIRLLVPTLAHYLIERPRGT